MFCDKRPVFVLELWVNLEIAAKIYCLILVGLEKLKSAYKCSYLKDFIFERIRKYF